KTAGGTNITRRKKSRSSLTSGPAGLFEQIASASSTITAEAVCALLEEGGSSSGQSSTKHTQGSLGRSRKKPVLVSGSGSVRRRRARLHKSSNSSMNGSSDSAVDAGAADTLTASPVTNLDTKLEGEAIRAMAAKHSDAAVAVSTTTWDSPTI
ncbi:hypothetical protein BX661DRAFT_198304, partial [Kickxella alabastrina]|uniref:uncharacterized protein n=1 Tax=Kickxella alabastrina TaxID=61397 RepID=UPI00221EB2FC